MRCRSVILMVLLLTALSAAPARGQTPGPASPPASASADLAGVTPLPLTGDRQAAFSAHITDLLAMTNVPGAAVAVVQNGEVVYQRGFGVHELDGSEPVTPDTLAGICAALPSFIVFDSARL